MNPVLKQLVLKDLRLNLPIMSMMTGAGLLALVLVVLGGRVGYAVGGILFITAFIAGGIFIGSYCIVQERKEQSSLFALSLPVSVMQLSAQKLIAALLIFIGPWIVLTLASSSVALIVDRIPDGLVVYSLLIAGASLATTCAFFALVSVATSEAASGFGILTLNMAFTLLMVSLGQPEWREPLSTTQIVWPGYALMLFAGEAAIVVASLVLAAALLSRRREAF